MSSAALLIRFIERYVERQNANDVAGARAIRYECCTRFAIVSEATFDKMVEEHLATARQPA